MGEGIVNSNPKKPRSTRSAHRARGVPRLADKHACATGTDAGWHIETRAVGWGLCLFRLPACPDPICLDPNLPGLPPVE